MKNKLWKQWMLSGVLVSAMVVSCGVSVSVQAEETTETEEAAESDSSAESEDDLRILFDQAVEDAMIAEDGEIPRNRRGVRFASPCCANNTPRNRTNLIFAFRISYVRYRKTYPIPWEFSRLL